MSSSSERPSKASKVKRVKVSPATPGAPAEGAEAGGQRAGRSVVAALRPLLALQALLGVGRVAASAGPAVSALQKGYAIAVSLALVYCTLEYMPTGYLLSGSETAVHHHVSSWVDLLECLVYILTATFAHRADLVSLLRKLDRVDAALGIESDEVFTRAAELRSYVTAGSVLFFNALAACALRASVGDVWPFLTTIVCRVAHDLEVSYFIAAVDTINSRLRAFERLVQPRSAADDAAEAADDTEKRRWWTTPELLDARPNACLTPEALWRVYADIVDCGIAFNETVSAQTLACGVSSFCHILIAVHLNLIRKQEVTNSQLLNPWMAVYLSGTTLRFVLNHMRACAATERSKTISRRINLHVHRQLCDAALDGRKRHSVESLALLTSRRPMRYTVYRIFQLDLSLPLGFFYLCVTYIIVLVQFAKL